MVFNERLNNAEVVLKSEKNKNEYFLFTKEIIVCRGQNRIYKRIVLPHIDDKVIGFYDMYYCKNQLCIIIATRGSYDLSFFLDEKKLELVTMGYCK